MARRRVTQKPLDLSDLSFETCMACNREEVAPEGVINDEITEWFYELGWWHVDGLLQTRDHIEGWVCNGCMGTLFPHGIHQLNKPTPL